MLSHCAGYTRQGSTHRFVAGQEDELTRFTNLREEAMTVYRDQVGDQYERTQLPPHLTTCVILDRVDMRSRIARSVVLNGMFHGMTRIVAIRSYYDAIECRCGFDFVVVLDGTTPQDLARIERDYACNLTQNASRPLVFDVHLNRVFVDRGERSRL